MSGVVAAAATATAVALLVGGPERRLERIRRGRPDHDSVATPVAAAIVLACAAMVLLLPMPLGLLLAWPAARGMVQLSRRLNDAPTTPPLAELALGLEVTAAAVGAGSAVPAGMRAAGATLDGPVGTAFTDAATAALFGADPGTALLDGLPGLPPAVAGVLRRSGLTGAAVSGPLLRAAQELHAAAAHAAEARVQAAAVRLVLPIGLCFLPAFVLVGVVPVVAGLAQRLW